MNQFATTIAILYTLIAGHIFGSGLGSLDSAKVAAAYSGKPILVELYVDD